MQKKLYTDGNTELKPYERLAEESEWIIKFSDVATEALNIIQDEVDAHFDGDPEEVNTKILVTKFLIDIISKTAKIDIRLCELFDELDK